MVKQFVVFGTEIYLYQPDPDDRLIKAKECVLCETLKEAKQIALQNLLDEYNTHVETIKSLRTKDVK